MTIDEQLKHLKALVTARDEQGAYAAGAALLARAPGLEYASYAAAWAAARLGKREECIAFIAPALAAKPDSFNYLSLHAQACLGLLRYAEALPAFLQMAAQRPDAPAAWKALLAIRAQYDPAPALPRNVMVVADDMLKAYRGRRWEQCRLLLAELDGVEPLTAGYWRMLLDDFAGLLPVPLEAWHAFHAHAGARLADGADPVSPLVDRNIAYNAFANFFSWLVKSGDSGRVMVALPTFQSLYRRPCPAKQAAAVAALLVRERRYAECLAILEGIEAEQPHDKARRDCRLQTYASRWTCRMALVAAGAPDAARLADALVAQMLAVAAPASPQRLVLDEYLLCWQAIRAAAAPAPPLRSRIKDALSGRRPFSLVLLGEDEACGMREVVPGLYASEAPLDIDRGVEMACWGGRLDAPRRRQLAGGFLDALGGADVVGLPGALRMAADLRGETLVKSAQCSLRELKYRVLFAGLRSLIGAGRAGAPGCAWEDAGADMALLHTADLGELVDAAAAVVLVGRCALPPGHALAQPKVALLPLAPAGDPAALDALARHLGELAGPGVLVLVGAGFAGKSLLALAKRAGAVALDAGAALDALMGSPARPPRSRAQPSARYPDLTRGGEAMRLGPAFDIPMEDRNPCGRLPLYIQERGRLATTTSVKMMDRDTFVCFSLVGRRAYAVRFDERERTFEVLDALDTTYAGEVTETDLCDADGAGNLLTGNFYKGSATLYRWDGGRLVQVRDLPLNVDGFMHGVKFFRPGIIAVSVSTRTTGVHFFGLDACELLLHIPTDLKTQDVCFLSDSRMAVLFVQSTPKSRAEEMYNAEIHVVDFSLEDRTFDVVRRVVYENVHIDCCVAHEGRLFINEQFNGRVIVLDAETLAPVGEIDGYDFPHGLDIGFATLAVSNYGRNGVTIRRFE